MDKIRVLSDRVANQIAAGEVVGRPASVVKELLENAVDAGSTSVTVNFKEGGRSLIHVVDNGCGMSDSDARMAFEHHATSKIKSTEDLYTLHSFGFRGEALPSISSVSEVELLTRPAEAELGTRVVIHGGSFVEQTPVQAPAGTQFLVKNLFYNVPARRRFLKEPHVEARHITSEFQRVVLCNPEIAFTLYNNDTLVYSLPVGNLRQRIAGVHGKGLANALLDLFVDTTVVKIEGYVGDPSLAKKTNKEQYLFVNGRYFRSPYFNKAVLQAYDKLIASDTQPSYFLYLTIDPAKIDVNVHPSKTEIKFDEEQVVWQIVNAAVRESLGRLGVVPMMDFEMDTLIDIPVYREGTAYKIPDVGANPDFNPFAESRSSSSSARRRELSSAKSDLDGWERLYDEGLRGVDSFTFGTEEFDSQLSAEAESEEESLVWTEGSELEFIEGEQHVQGLLDIEGGMGFRGVLRLSDQLYATALGDALAVVDTSRAWERVMYERYLRLLGNHTAVSQQLLFPERIELTPDDLRMLDEATEDLLALGFEFSLEPPHTIEVLGIPPEISVGMAEEALTQILVTLHELGHIPPSERKEKMAAVLARQAARSKQKIDEGAVEFLLEELMACDNKRYTPSGAPIMVWMDRAEIMKRLAK